MTELLSALFDSPGLYAGPQDDPEAAEPSGSIARVVVTVLPGGAGVSFDYEVWNADGHQGHLEHSLLVRTPTGLGLLATHSHSQVATWLIESEPGYFTVPEGALSPFPMAIRLEVPEVGHLVYSWSYGPPGDPLRVRDVGDLRRVG